METPAKPKRLPITQKFYAFYHAPIVKFWFNTVSFLLCNMFFLFVLVWFVSLFLTTSAGIWDLPVI